MTASAEILPKSPTAWFRARFRLARGFPYVSATVLSAVIVAAVFGPASATYWAPSFVVTCSSTILRPGKSRRICTR